MGFAVVVALAAAAPAPSPVAADADFRLIPVASAVFVEPVPPRLLLTAREDGASWRSRLVAADPDAGRSGRPSRPQRIAAGLSFRMVNDGGTLASTIGMAGAVGRALDRIASQAITAVTGAE